MPSIPCKYHIQQVSTNLIQPVSTKAIASFPLHIHFLSTCSERNRGSFPKTHALLSSEVFPNCKLIIILLCSSSSETLYTRNALVRCDISCISITFSRTLSDKRTYHIYPKVHRHGCVRGCAIATVFHILEETHSNPIPVDRLDCGLLLHPVFEAVSTACVNLLLILLLWILPVWIPKWTSCILGKPSNASTRVARMCRISTLR